MKIAHDKLEKYILTFRPSLQEVIWKNILDSNAQEKTLSSDAGRLLLNSVADSIAGNVLKIVDACIENPPEKIDIYRYAIEINVAYKMVNEWSKTEIRGSEHKDKIEKG